MDTTDYVTRIFVSPEQVNAKGWDALLRQQGVDSPFMRHAYLKALHDSRCASPTTGWGLHFIVLEAAGQMVAACAVYVKEHSYGEYVFDWAWANAYHQHGIPYYPKALVAVPFTPVSGARLLATNPTTRVALVRAVLRWCADNGLSSLHLLFTSPEDVKACAAAGLMLRHTVQFHWTNTQPGYADFDAFLATLAQDKRKKIRQERRKVLDAGVSFRCVKGVEITQTDWDFFYKCYERTYLEHGNAPYLNRDFFGRMAQSMPQNWVLFVAERQGTAIASSLIAVGNDETPKVAYGRYWGALERVDCLHFEACYYQPLQWCIENNYQCFEGGAQGEHKMARALLPIITTSAHWLAHPEFSEAVARFLDRESQGVQHYMEDLEKRNPFKLPD
jgi:predicted N-acyltransferase